MPTLYFNSNDEVMKRIVSRCPTLHESYKPPWWCFGPWMNVVVMIIKERFAPTMPIKRDTIICPDGGEVSIDWADDEISKNLPIEAPVLGILHTITGSARQNAGFMQYAARRGWRSCVLNRRGHSGMPIRVVPNAFSIMGNVDDTVIMVKKMRIRFPNNFIGLAGVSAGSGQLVSYIGREGDQVLINGAASLCPAWDISSAFKNLQNKFPWVDRYVTRGIVNHFLRPPQNQIALAKMPEVVSRAITSKTLGEFMDHSAPLAACRDLDHFYQENNPMQYFTGNTTPCLVLNALDDFLCLKENIRYDVKDQVHNYCLAITDYGSHIAYNEGFFGTGNFMWRITLDFFETIKEC